MTVQTPESTQDASAILQDAARQGRRVAIRGGGTKSDWGAGQPSADVVVSTLGLNRLVAHRYGDLTATIEAGARLDDVNRELARHGQMLPLDPAWSDRATIGGVVATNDAGPRRHRYGAPRDLIIGVEIIRADGVAAKAGGIVVKNVAGYDVARLMTGSFGSLALITSATFKLFPIAAASRTVVVELQSHSATAVVLDAITGSQLTPSAVECHTPPRRLLVRFESTEASVTAQSNAVARIVEDVGMKAAIVDGQEERQLWDLHRERPWTGDGAVMKVTLLPNEIASVLDLLDGATDATCEIAGRAGLGVLFVRIDAAASVQAAMIGALRARVPLARGSVTLLRGSDQLKTLVDAWGPRGDAYRVMRSVKEAFDPKQTFASGFV